MDNINYEALDAIESHTEKDFLDKHNIDPITIVSKAFWKADQYDKRMNGELTVEFIQVVDENTIECRCPSCGRKFYYINHTPAINYCSNCGIYLDWIKFINEKKKFENGQK